ncbi:MAG TPA: hypothetical protein VF530_21535 [Planctomycetota bacterium]
MNPRSMLFPTVAALFLLASTGLAQQPTPVIGSIPSRNAFDPGRVVINGSNLGLVLEVKVNGISLPITRVNATRLVAGPLPPQPPGFAPVELIWGRGRLNGILELTPNLSCSRRGLRITSRVNNGDAGSYVLRFSTAALAEPVVDVGVYHARLLPLEAPILGGGVFLDATPVTVTHRVPVQVGMIGTPLFLQARCVVGAELFESYTNLAQVSGLGQHQ